MLGHLHLVVLWRVGEGIGIRIIERNAGDGGEHREFCTVQRQRTYRMLARDRLRPRRSEFGSTEIDTCLPPEDTFTTCPYEDASDDLLALGDREMFIERGDACNSSREGDLEMREAICSGDATSCSCEGGLCRLVLDCLGETALTWSFHANDSATDAAKGSTC